MGSDFMICGIAAPRCFWLNENTQRWLPIASGMLQSQSPSMSILTSPEDWKTKWPRASIGNSINQMKRGAQIVNPLERLFLILPPRDSNPDNVIQSHVSYH